MGLNCRQHHDFMLPLVPIVQAIGLRGLPIDLVRRQEMLSTLAARIGTLDITLSSQGLTAPSSTRKTGIQLRELGVPLTEMTPKKTQYKLDAEIIGKINWLYNIRPGGTPKFPFLHTLLLRARLAKAYENISGLVVCNDGLLRTSLKACNTRTSRYASSGFGRKNKPGFCPVCLEWGQHGTNLQNITRGCAVCGSPPADCTCKDGGVHIKSLFTSWPTWKLGELDYAALELRIMAYRIRCDKLIGRLERGDDLHTLHAQIMFPGLPITKRRRVLAKNLIYAIRGAGGARAVKIELAKKGEYVEESEIENWRLLIFAEYPEIPAWIAEVDEMLARQTANKERRVIRNAFGRPRVLLGYQPLKEALADEISSTAAYIMNFVLRRGMYKAPRVFNRICMQFHDAFGVHAPKDEFDSVMGSLKEEMERPVWHWDQFVKYPVECKAGGQWSDLKPWAS